jgi:uncharacterized repeat protein (TIGR02543 family)
VTADADADYLFTGWTGDYDGGDNPLTITNVQADMTIQANFSNNTRVVIFSASDGGSVSGELNQIIEQGTSTRPVTALPEAGYHFKNWTDESGAVVGTDSALSLTEVTSDLAISANFEINTYTVVFTASDGGRVIGNTRQNVLHGKNCSSVTAEANANYQFTGWTGDYVGRNNPLIITNVQSDMRIQANFSNNTFVVTFSASDGGNVSGNPTRQSVREAQPYR